jgi:hypothetical protein
LIIAKRIARQEMASGFTLDLSKLRSLVEETADWPADLEVMFYQSSLLVHPVSRAEVVWNRKAND